MMVEQVCGLDEVGRGALAGPIVAAAVIFPADFDFVRQFPKLRFGDSKTLSYHQREAAYDAIIAHALIWQTAVIDVPEIDREGIGWANRTIFVRLIELIDAERYIVDGNLRLQVSSDRSARVSSVVRADQTESAVSAASIIAKVTRDRLMQALHTIYPVYDWQHNVGYGTSVHRAALYTHGRSPHHRRLFSDTALRNYLAAQTAWQTPIPQ